MIKVDMAHEHDYKMKNYLLWITPSKEQVEVVRTKGGYAKWSKENSTLIINIISQQ